MEKRFLEHLQKTELLPSGQKILVAVSGGVDSVVLLSLLKRFQSMFCWELAIAHVNHGLRAESASEAVFVRKFAEDSQLTYFEETWEESGKLTSGIEENARLFRYSFFSFLMKEYAFDVLVTAHHGDDQIETQLMKWIRGNYAGNLKGILESQTFAGGKLVRPLLPFAKKELLKEAERLQLASVEDSSNADTRYFRNRIRKQFLPLIQQENPNAVKSANRFSKQLSYLEEVANDSFLAWFQGEGKLNLTKFLLLGEAKRYLYLLAYFRQREIFLSASEVEEILDVLTNPEKPNWQVKVSEKFDFVKTYQQADLVKISEANVEQSYTLSLGECVQLSKNERLIFGEWKEMRGEIEEYFTPYSEIFLRHPLPGDRLKVTENLNKKLSRVLIDQKIPAPVRKSTWILADERGILSVLGVKNSYLSKKIETDKIKNRIFYVKTDNQIK